MNSPNYYYPSSSLSSLGLRQNLHNAIDEIRDEIRLDKIQSFGDEYYWNEESDFEVLYEDVSPDYIDFLLSFE